MIKFQYISDIHLEFLKNIPKINKIAENICLLGDIGIPGSVIYNDFILFCSNKFKNVFIIYGNHEYFNTKKTITSNGIESMLKREEYTANFPKNVYFLNNSHIYIDKQNNNVLRDLHENQCKNNYIKIIGTTLWSDIDNNIYTRFEDYKRIYISEKEKITPEYTKFLFQTSKNYIIEEISREDISCILMTHHGTHDLCNGKYGNNNLNSAYATYIHELYNMKNLLICLNGHTHSNINESIITNGNTVRLLSNCKGYPGENRDIVMYNQYAYFEI